MFNKIKSFFSNQPEQALPAVAIIPITAEQKMPAPEVISPKVVNPRKPRKPKVVEPVPVVEVDPNMLAKAEATARGEPWVTVLGIEMDADNVGNGSFNLDWNPIFVAKLVKAGYRGENDIQIVDQWFTDLARNIVLETYQQHVADPDKRNKTTP